MDYLDNETINATQANNAINNIVGMASTGKQIDDSVEKDLYLARIISKMQKGRKRGAVVGDSISQSTIAADPLNKSYYSIFRKSLMKELGYDNQGYVDISSNFNWNVANVGVWDYYAATSNFANSWTGYGYYGTGASARFTWTLLNTSTVPSSTLTVSNNFKIGYMSDTTEHSFRVYINGIAGDIITVPADATPKQYFTNIYSFTGNVWNDHYGKVHIILQTGTKLTVTGISFLNNPNNIVFDNLSKGGRKTLEMSSNVITEICSNYDFLIWAMGTNDGSYVGAEQVTVLARLEDLKTQAIANNVPIIFLDLMWRFPSDNYYRVKIRELAMQIPNSKIISIPELISFDGDTTTDQERIAMGFSTDGTHLTDYGNIFVGNLLCNEVGLSFDSQYRFGSDLTFDATSNYYYKKQTDYGVSNGVPSASTQYYFRNLDIYTDISSGVPVRKYYNSTTKAWVNA